MLKKLFTAFHIPSRHAVTKFTGIMSRLEEQCDSYCPEERPRSRKITIIGAGSDVGRIASLFLKQAAVVETLALYDGNLENKVLELGADLCHLDTSPMVEAYQGRSLLLRALKGAEVVLICGGLHLQPGSRKTDHQIFLENRSFVRSSALTCAEFCNHAFLAIATPPVDCMLSMVAHLYKKNGVYDRKRIIGINSVASMRASAMVCAETNANPCATHLPIVGGTCSTTLVPVFSSDKSTTTLSQEKLECMTTLVREADEIICCTKNNGEQAHLAIGFACARCIINVMKGLFSNPAFIDSALVEQENPEKCYNLQFCSSSLTVGKDGIMQYGIPHLSPYEKKLLDKCSPCFLDRLNLGRCYALGEEYVQGPCGPPPPLPPSPCAICEPSEFKLRKDRQQ